MAAPALHDIDLKLLRVFAAVVERHTLRLCLEPDAGRPAKTPVL